MTAKYSRKKYLEFYRRATSEEQEMLRKCLKHDIANNFNYLYFKVLFRIGGNEEKIIERVLSSEQMSGETFSKTAKGRGVKMDNDLSFIYSALSRKRDMAQKFLHHIQNTDDTSMHKEGSDKFLEGQIKAYEMALRIVRDSISLCKE